MSSLGYLANFPKGRHLMMSDAYGVPLDSDSQRVFHSTLVGPHHGPPEVLLRAFSECTVRHRGIGTGQIGTIL